MHTFRKLFSDFLSLSSSISGLTSKLAPLACSKAKDLLYSLSVSISRYLPQFGSKLLGELFSKEIRISTDNKELR